MNRKQDSKNRKTDKTSHYARKHRAAVRERVARREYRLAVREA